MGKTLFITDLDGTLLNSNAEITPFTAKIINNLIDEGMIFTYASARSFVTALKVTGAINFKYPAVCFNGVFVQDPKTGEYLDKCICDKEKIAEVIRICETNGFYPFVYAFIDGMERVSWIKGEETSASKFYLEGRTGDKRLRPVKNYGEFYDGEIYAIVFHGNFWEELEGILQVLNLDSQFAYYIAKDTYKNNCGQRYCWFEIIRFDATKDFGVKKVKELVGADKIVCFGDNINDIPMFDVSDEKYAVANAVPEIKNIATDIIGSNDGDGVAKWLEKYARGYL